MGVRRVFAFCGYGNTRPRPELAVRRGFTPDSFLKSTFFAPPGVAPGRRFWHGPGKFEAALLGRVGLLFMRLPRPRRRRGGRSKKSEANVNDSIMGDCALRSAFDRLR